MGEQTDKHTQGRGHSIFPPPPIWCHVLGSDVFAPPRGQREQGGVVPSHSNRLAEEHCRRIKQTSFRCLDRYQRWPGGHRWSLPQRTRTWPLLRRPNVQLLNGIGYIILIKAHWHGQYDRTGHYVDRYWCHFDPTWLDQRPISQCSLRLWKQTTCMTGRLGINMCFTRIEVRRIPIFKRLWVNI